MKKIVVHRIGIQMCKKILVLYLKPLKIPFTANSTVHSYNTRNRHKLRAARGMHKYILYIIYIARFVLLVHV